MRKGCVGRIKKFTQVMQWLTKRLAACGMVRLDQHCLASAAETVGTAPALYVHKTQVSLAIVKNRK